MKQASLEGFGRESAPLNTVGRQREQFHLNCLMPSLFLQLEGRPPTHTQVRQRRSASQPEAKDHAARRWVLMSVSGF